MRKNDKLDAIEKYILEKQIEDGIRRGLWKWARTVCMTATSAVIAIFYAAGGFIYEKWHPLQVAIRAFIESNRP